MKRMAVSGGLLLVTCLAWGMNAMARVPKPPRPLSCTERCDENLKRCSQVCKTHAGAGAQICIRECSQRQNECKTECKSERR